MSQQHNGIFERFDAIRKYKGLTYQEIEDLSGVPKQTLFGLKRRDSINIKTLTALAKCLGVSTDQLLGMTPLIINPRNIDDLKPEKQNQPKLIEIPVWKLSSYGDYDTVKYRNMSEEIGRKTFGIAVDQTDTNFPKGTILFFNPEVIPQTGSIVFIKMNNKDDHRIRKIIIERGDTYFSHIKFDITEKLSDVSVYATCTTIITDVYFASFD